jgi:hypothetical protein
MVYTASLTLPVKKALGNKCHQSSVAKIIELMPVDPQVSNMDIVFIGPRDLEGPYAKKVQAAVDTKHPGVCLIYLYSSEKERALLKCKYSKEVKKVKDSDINDAITEFYGNHTIAVSNTKLQSAYDKTEIVDFKYEPEQQKKVTVAEEEPATPAPVVPVPEAVQAPEVATAPVAEAEAAPVSKESLEEKLSGIKDFHDWDVFKKSLAQDSITRHLIEENTEYQGILNMLDVYDLKIRDVFNNITISAEEKFKQIREFGKKRTVLKEAENRIACQKLIDLMETVVRAAGLTVDEKINGVQDAITKIAADKKSVIESMEYQPLIEKKLNIQLELMNMVKELIEVYKVMDVSVADRIADMDKGLPSENEYISEMVNPVKNLFLPENSPSLTTLLMDSLQKGRVTMSAMEDRINGIMNLVFELGGIDQEIIEYQQKIINMLRAHRVEDIVIRDSLIKDVLRIFVGSPESGKTATALAWAGMMSKRGNTLVVDLSEKSKLRLFGANPMNLEEFLIEQTQKPFLFVSGTVEEDPEKIFKLSQKLREMTSYYPCIAVILDAAKPAVLEQLSGDALSVHYVTNCSVRSIEDIRKVIKEHTSENIARKLVVIDAPCDIMDIVKELGVDITVTQVIPIPYLRGIRACLFKHMLPHEDSTVLAVFEEAFKK